MSISYIELSKFLIHAKQQNKHLFSSKFPEMNYDKVIVEPGARKIENECIETTQQEIDSLFRTQQPWNICLELIKGSYVILKQIEGLVEKDLRVPDDIIPYIEYLLRLAGTPYYHPLYHELGQQKFIASTGGKARSHIYHPAKQEAARLFETCKPANGWMSIAQAIDEIDEKLYEFIRAQRIPLKQAALPETLRRWTRKDTELRSALEKTLSTEARARIGILK